MNVIILTGNLTADPVITVSGTSDGDLTIAHFTLAVRRDSDTTDFIRCTAFRRTAELIENYCVKGDKLGVCGELHIEQVEDKKTGEMSYYTNVLVNKIDFMTKKEDKNKDVDNGKKPVQTKRR